MKTRTAIKMASILIILQITNNTVYYYYYYFHYYHHHRHYYYYYYYYYYQFDYPFIATIVIIIFRSIAGVIIIIPCFIMLSGLIIVTETCMGCTLNNLDPCNIVI